MIPAGVQVFVAVQPVNLRFGFERLAGIVAETFGYEARGGALFVFLNKRRDALKLLFFDGTGLCIFYKRLDHGLFQLPMSDSVVAGVVGEISEQRLEALLDGINLEPVVKADKVARRRIH